jgi:hypothetical protein
MSANGVPNEKAKTRSTAWTGCGRSGVEYYVFSFAPGGCSQGTQEPLSAASLSPVEAVERMNCCQPPLAGIHPHSDAETQATKLAALRTQLDALAKRSGYSSVLVEMLAGQLARTDTDLADARRILESMRPDNPGTTKPHI